MFWSDKLTNQLKTDSVNLIKLHNNEHGEHGEQYLLHV